MQTSDIHLYNLLRAITTGEGILVVTVFLLAAACMLMFRQARWVVLTLLLYMVTHGVYEYYRPDDVLSFPLQHLRIYSRSISFGLIVLLLIATFRSERGWRRHFVTTVIACFFLLEMTFSVRSFFGGDPTRGILGGAFYSLLFVTLVFGLGRWIQTVEDVYTALRCVVFAALIFTVTSLYQYALNPYLVVWANRFLGTTSNAQHAAVLLASSLLPACFLFARPDATPKSRLFYGGVAGLLAVLLVWTGSRTGFLMGVVGVALLFRFRFGKLALAIIVAGSVALVAKEVLSESTAVADRLIATDDTRTMVWKRMIGDFLGQPLIGTDVEEASFSENSYLLTAARMGIVGLIPLGLTVGFALRNVLRLRSMRRNLGDDALLADLLIASVGSFAAGAMFESFLLGLFSFPVICLYIYGAILAFMSDAAAQQPVRAPAVEAREAAMTPAYATN